MKIIKVISGAMFMVLSNNSGAALYERLGGLAYYDDVANITWLADANAAGPMTWNDSMDWTTGLSVAGVTGWRLPNFTLGSPNSELRYMFYNNLGGVSGVPIGVTHNTNYDLFSNIQSARYWYSNIETGCVGSTEPCATIFNMNGGFTDSWPQTLSFYAWAVHDGDVVPLPAAAWLFASGLMGLGIFARRKKD